jgi:DNA-binding response OmpR family regulator
MKPMKLAEIAARINAHLQRIEKDPKLNPWNEGKANGTKPYYCSTAYVGGAGVGVRYVCYQGTSYMKKAEAVKYLAWLDAGNVGKHFNLL